MAVLLVGLFAAFLGVAALQRTRRELGDGRGVSRRTVLLAFATYSQLTICIVAAAWFRVWPVALDAASARIAGGILVTIGAGIYLAARVRFGSFQLTWGRRLDRLVIDGIYRFSRNPQALGAVLILGGVSIAARSAGAMALVAIYACLTRCWIHVEEKALEHHFGDVYRSYRSRVRRYA